MWTITKADLSAALDRVAAATAEHGMPTFAGMVLIERQDDQNLRLIANNLLLAIDTACLAADAKGDESIAVNHRRLAASVAQMPEGSLKIQVDAKLRLKLTCGRERQFTIAGQATTDFPRPPNPEGETEELPGGELARVLDRTRYAAVSKDRPRIDGVEIVLTADRLIAVGMSSALFARIDQPRTKPGKALSFFVPNIAGKSVGALGTGPLKVSKSERALFIESEATLLVVSLPGGDFPPWRMMVDSLKRSPVGRVHAPAALEALRAVTAARAEYIELKLQDKSVELTAGIEEECVARDVVPIEPTNPDAELRVQVNPSYLQETIRAADAHFILEQTGDHIGVVTEDSSFLAFVARIVR